jgi:hypothetical protein
VASFTRRSSGSRRASASMSSVSSRSALIPEASRQPSAGATARALFASFPSDRLLRDRYEAFGRQLRQFDRAPH